MHAPLEQGSTQSAGRGRCGRKTIWRPIVQASSRRNSPQFVFASKNNKFSFALGGYIALRTAYEFEGTVNNLDFVPYDIPIPELRHPSKVDDGCLDLACLPKSHRQHPRSGPYVVVYVDGDFRGSAQGSYIPRLRSAYVSFKGFTVGRDITTFCDLMAAPTTIDFRPQRLQSPVRDDDPLRSTLRAQPHDIRSCSRNARRQRHLQRLFFRSAATTHA